MRGYRLLSIAAALVTSVAVATPPTATATESADLSRQPAAEYLRVIKPYGAAVQAAPTNYSATLFTASCDDVFPLLNQSGDWYEVYVGLTYLPGVETGWIGGGRVQTGAYPPSADCGGAPTFPIAETVRTYVATGCLSLRPRPSRQAAILSCVNNHHVYLIVNGPLDPGTGED